MEAVPLPRCSRVFGSRGRSKRDAIGRLRTRRRVNADVNGAWHFCNIVDGRRIDFTMSQFSGPIFYDDIPSGREEALLDCSQEQYDLLRSRVEAMRLAMRNS
jgi:hypothetical protein